MIDKEGMKRRMRRFGEEYENVRNKGKRKRKWEWFNDIY